MGMSTIFYHSEGPLFYHGDGTLHSYCKDILLLGLQQGCEETYIGIRSFDILDNLQMYDVESEL